MEGIDEFDIAAMEIVAQKAEPILARKLSELGVNSPSELPKDVARELFASALAEVALRHFPGADIAKLQMGARNFTSPDFAEAVNRIEKTAKSDDAFSPATGPDAAVILAAIGIEVAPLDKKDFRLLASFSRELPQVKLSFEKYKTAFVGYCCSTAEFYVLSTDCLQTLRRLVVFDKRFSQVKMLLNRSATGLPEANEPFVHFCCVLARHDGDEISTVAHIDDHPERGSVIMYAGWVDENGPQGAPQNGIIPAPLALVKAVIKDPKLAWWLTEEKESFSAGPKLH